MDNLYRQFEKYISYTLMILAMIFVCYQVLDLVIHFTIKIADDIKNQQMVLEKKGKPIEGIFFSVLLTLEIIQTIKVFAHDHSVKLRIILIVGLIAVTRKILMYDMEDVNPLSEFAVAALIISLSTGYYLVTRSEKFNINQPD